MLPCLGQRLAASPKQGHFDKFDEWKSHLPAVFAENCARALSTKVAPCGSAKTFVALPSLVAGCQQNTILSHRMEEVSAYGTRQPSLSKEQVSIPRRLTAFPQASRKLN